MGDKNGKDVDNTQKIAKRNFFGSIFVHADRIDKLLMTMGFLGSMGDGFITPLILLISSKVMNNVGQGPGEDPHLFLDAITKNCLSFLYLSCGIFVTCFIEAYCWTRTGERQASRIRHKYLKAVLRQDICYFDLKASSTSEVVTSVTNDTLVIQDVIGEKIPHFLMSVFMFIGSYIIAFILLWRLAIVGFPFAFVLIIPGLMYGRILMGLARKVREEYNKAGAIVEQAISSVRTVYSFVGETKTMDEFSAALQGTVKLGLKQGLAKGVAIGTNGITFAIWAFMAWYGSRMVMYHGSEGGTIFAVGTSIAIGGLSLGAGLSNVKYFSEAGSAGERIMEVIKRVPDIDTDNVEGEVLQSVVGEVEFKNLKFVGEPS